MHSLHILCNGTLYAGTPPPLPLPGVWGAQEFKKIRTGRFELTLAASALWRLFPYLRCYFSISGVWIFELFFAIVFSTRALYFFCLGTFCDESTLGFFWFLFVFGVSSRYPAFASLSSASRLFFNERTKRTLCLFCMGTFCDESTLGFL